MAVDAYSKVFDGQAEPSSITNIGSFVGDKVRFVFVRLLFFSFDCVSQAAPKPTQGRNLLVLVD